MSWAGLRQLAVLGIVGAALIQWLYFIAIDRLPVGIALLLEFTAPVIVAVFARLVLREAVRGVVWVALVLSLAGLGLVAQVWQDTRLDAVGVAAGLGGAACLATFLLLGRHSGGSHDPVAVNFWMFAWASAFWLVVEPLWGIDWAPLGQSTSLLGVFDTVEVPVWLATGWVIALGTLAPYALDLAALRNLPATTVGAVGMLEPVVAAAVAWLWLEQALTTAQVIGGLVVLAGVGARAAARPERPPEPIPDPPIDGASIPGIFTLHASVPAMSIYDVSINRLDGSPADLHDYEGKAVLLVNVASQCGLTPQYTGLEQLQDQYAEQGFTVLGVPCNQFGGQEPGSAEEIATFCSTNYGVTFPMTEKVEVNGDGRHELYQQLVDVADPEGHTGDIRWNFEKFLIAPGGEVVARFNPMTDPTSDEVVAAVEKTLPA